MGNSETKGQLTAGWEKIWKSFEKTLSVDVYVHIDGRYESREPG